MPAKQGVRCDQEGGPAAAGKQPAQGSQQGPVGRAVAHPTAQLSFEDPHLVAQDEDLEVLIGFAAPPTDNEFEDPAQAEVDQGEGHGRRS